MSEQPLVKELQWRFFDVTHEYGKGVWDANGPWTTYTIQVCDEARAAPAERYYVPALSDVFSDLDAAKAAAQADYERRILSALTPAPVRAEGEALRKLKSRLDYRFNEHLCEMKPDYDDSITGFNEAWRIVDRVFADASTQSGDLERQLHDENARLKEAATNAAGYLRTGFFECPRCGEEVPSSHSDAELELRDVLAALKAEDSLHG